MKFWKIQNSTNGSEMFLEGPISQDTWFGDEVTPKQFKAELKEHEGKDLTVWINSPGGDVFAASTIYTALKERRGRTTVKIDGLAASAASVIAMAGDSVQISPTAMIMVHNPITGVWGDEHDLKHTIKVLKEVKESIINAYEIKTRLSRHELADLMDKETWMNAKEAKRLNFVDQIIHMDGRLNNSAQSMTVDQSKYTAQISAKLKEQIKSGKPDDQIQREAVWQYLDMLQYNYK